MNNREIDVDDKFYDRADSFINLANEYVAAVSNGKISASFMFAQARYAACVSASRALSAEDMESGKEETVAYFVGQFELMLRDNLDDYIANFGDYSSNSESKAKPSGQGM